jgi:hypothetical protein
MSGGHTALKKNHNFIHQIVNHNKNFINPHTGAQTQTTQLFIETHKIKI